MSVSFCLPHPVAVSAFMICRAIITCIPESERVALKERRKIAPPNKCARGFLHINTKSKQRAETDEEWDYDIQFPALAIRYN